MNSFDREFIVIVARQHDYRDIGRLRMCFFKCSEARRRVGQTEIQKHYVNAPFFQMFQARAQPGNMSQFVPDGAGVGQVCLDKECVIRIILDEQYSNLPAVQAYSSPSFLKLYHTDGIEMI